MYVSMQNYKQNSYNENENKKKIRRRIVSKHNINLLTSIFPDIQQHLIATASAEEDYEQ